MIDPPAMARGGTTGLQWAMALGRGSAQAGGEVATARVRVAAPPSLCLVQRTTRALCRSAGFSEDAVYESVVLVTDFAYRLCLERAGAVDIDLSALRHRDGLELRAENSAPGGPARRVSLPFPQ